MSLTNGLLSDTAVSNLFTMQLAAEQKPDQSLPVQNYTMPSFAVRCLRSRLIFEEAMETIRDLGVSLVHNGAKMPDLKDFAFVDNPEAIHLENAIDGCCDTIYVCTGTLMAMGVPDVPHLNLVNNANNAKFPNGVATLDEHGKYQKPPGWVAPCHLANPHVSVGLGRAAEKLVADCRTGIGENQSGAQ